MNSFHFRDGLSFTRLPGGGVRITKMRPGTPCTDEACQAFLEDHPDRQCWHNAVDDWAMDAEPGEWLSIVTSMAWPDHQYHVAHELSRLVHDGTAVPTPKHPQDPQGGGQ